MNAKIRKVKMKYLNLYLYLYLYLKLAPSKITQGTINFLRADNFSINKNDKTIKLKWNRMNKYHIYSYAQHNKTSSLITKMSKH